MSRLCHSADESEAISPNFGLFGHNFALNYIIIIIILVFCSLLIFCARHALRRCGTLVVAYIEHLTMSFDNGDNIGDKQSSWKQQCYNTLPWVLYTHTSTLLFKGSTYCLPSSDAEWPWNHVTKWRRPMPMRLKLQTGSWERTPRACATNAATH